MQSRVFTDQLGRGILVPFPPKRIISLVPSQTELLFDLGLDEEIIGITKFCVHPGNKVKGRQKIGGTKTVDIAKIRALKPDLIIANKEENERSQIESLMAEFPVWISDITTLDDSLEMIRMLGDVLDRVKAAEELADRISSEFKKLSQAKYPSFRSSDLPPLTSHLQPTLSIAYFIWKNPYMVAGTGTFIDNMLHYGGWKNAFSESRYPEINREQLISANPDVIFLSSEPYPFRDKHIAEFKALCPQSAVIVVDGEMFSWYGSRLLQTPSYISELRVKIKANISTLNSI